MGYQWGASTGRYVVGFAQHQMPPDGYTVEWWDCDEMYHWVKLDPADDPHHPNVYSGPTCCRWSARRGAIRHANTQTREAP